MPKAVAAPGSRRCWAPVREWQPAIQTSTSTFAGSSPCGETRTPGCRVLDRHIRRGSTEPFGCAALATASPSPMRRVITVTLTAGSSARGPRSCRSTKPPPPTTAARSTTSSGRTSRASTRRRFSKNSVSSAPSSSDGGPGRAADEVMTMLRGPPRAERLEVVRL